VKKRRSKKLIELVETTVRKGSKRKGNQKREDEKKL